MDRLEKIVEFCRTIDREKFIQRKTYLTDGERLENDAEHAWHLAVMALLLGEYSNAEIDLLSDRKGTSEGRHRMTGRTAHPQLRPPAVPVIEDPVIEALLQRPL